MKLKLKELLKIAQPNPMPAPLPPAPVPPPAAVIHKGIPFIALPIATLVGIAVGMLVVLRMDLTAESNKVLATRDGEILKWIPEGSTVVLPRQIKPDTKRAPNAEGRIEREVIPDAVHKFETAPAGPPTVMPPANDE